MINNKIAVIGAGAAGMTAAITAAKYGMKITLYEKNDRVGKKILATGNGKCNLSNIAFHMDQYYCEDKEKLCKIFDKFTVQDTICWFEQMGLMIREKNGYLYPYSEQASTVLDILRIQLEKAGIKVSSDCDVIDITFDQTRKEFQIKDTLGKCTYFAKVIMACGSPASLKKGEGRKGYELAKKLGHRIKKVVPGLVQLQSDEKFVKTLAGVRCQGLIRLQCGKTVLATESGELQFTDYGISGIPVFQISRIASYAIAERKEITIHVDFIPEYEKKSEYDFNNWITKRFETKKEETIEQFLIGTANKKINMVIMKEAGLKPDVITKEAGYDAIHKMMLIYRNFIIHINNSNTEDKAQICAGGVDFSEITENMESTKTPGLFFAGEMIDVDGKCGGYNLQWAWTSGHIAGRSAAGKREKDA